jgi:hypothetical protein
MRGARLATIETKLVQYKGLFDVCSDRSLRTTKPRVSDDHWPSLGFSSIAFATSASPTAFRYMPRCRAKLHRSGDIWLNRIIGDRAMVILSVELVDFPSIRERQAVLQSRIEADRDLVVGDRVVESAQSLLIGESTKEIWFGEIGAEFNRLRIRIDSA